MLQGASIAADEMRKEKSAICICGLFCQLTHTHRHTDALALARSNTHTSANSDELALVDRKMSHLLRGDSKQPSGGGGKLPRIGRTQWLRSLAVVAVLGHPVCQQSP